MNRIDNDEVRPLLLAVILIIWPRDSMSYDGVYWLVYRDTVALAHARGNQGSNSYIPTYYTKTI